MGTSFCGKFPFTSRIPEGFFGVRLRLLKLAVSSGFSNHFSQPWAFLCCLLRHYIPAVRSTLSWNCLPERSSISAAFLFINFCKPMIGEKLLLILRPFRFQFDNMITWVFRRLLLFLNQHLSERFAISFFADEPDMKCFGSNFSFFRMRILRSERSGLWFN